MTYGSDRILWKGRYGYVHVVPLKSWNAGIKRAREEYYQYPFARKDISPNPKPYTSVKSRRFWTARDERYLTRKRAEGVSYQTIAKSLKRSKMACQMKAVKLGIVTKRSKRGRGEQDLSL